MKLQINNFILFAVGTSLGNRITCNVPDGKPSSIPQDCQVCLDTIVVTNDKSTWPTKKLALQEITNTLSVQADLPPFLQIPLQVETLEVHGFIPKKMQVENITAKVLHFNRVCGTSSISIDGIKPEVVIFEHSNIKVTGIASDALSMFSAVRSTLYETSLYNLKSAGSISFDQCTFNAGQIFPNLTKVHNLFIGYSKVSEFDIPIMYVTGELKVPHNSNISYINFPNLKQVNGKIKISGDEKIQTVNFSSLTNAGKIDVGVNTTFFELPSNITWKEESNFNVDNFCEAYHSKFTAAGLKFKSTKPCETECDRRVTLTPENYPEIMKCKVVKDLILDGNLFHGQAVLPNLQEVVGTLALIDFTHDARFPSLKKVGESLHLVGDSNLAVTSLSDLEVPSLKVLNNINQQPLEFNNLRLNNNLFITNSSFAMISGINAKTLNTVNVTNNPNLWELHLPNLSHVQSMTLVDNPQLLYLEKTFPNLGRVAKSLHVEKSNIANLKLSVESIQQDLILINNPALKKMEMPFLAKNSGSLVSQKNPKFSTVLIGTESIEIPKGVDTTKVFNI